MSVIEIRKVESGKDQKVFINFPWALYKNDPTWVPPLKMAVKDMLNPKHPFYETAETVSFIAFKHKDVAGRLMVINPIAYNSYHKSKSAFFGFYEVIKDHEVSEKLFKKACNWAKDLGLTEMLGPFNLSSNYESGLLVEGFDDPPQVMMTYNPSYYQKHLESLGFNKEMDMYAYNVSYPVTMPEVILKIAERAEKRNKISYRFLNTNKFDEEVGHMFDIYNDAWEKNWGFVPMTEKEFRHTAKELKMIINEKLVVFAEVDGETAGFIVGIPDLNQVFKKIPNGNLLPFGLFKILNHKSHVSRMRVPTMGVKQKFRKLGLETLLYRKCQLEAEKTGLFESCEASWILESNVNMTKPLLKMGFEPYKTYRIYKKQLN